MHMEICTPASPLGHYQVKPSKAGAKRIGIFRGSSHPKSGTLQVEGHSHSLSQIFRITSVTALQNVFPFGNLITPS